MIDLDVDSLYPHVFDMNLIKPKIRTLTLKRLPGVRQPFIVIVQGGNWFEDRDVMMEWCGDRFGRHDKHYNNPRWSREGWDFKFKNEKDAMLFMLRWG